MKILTGIIIGLILFGVWISFNYDLDFIKDKFTMEKEDTQYQGPVPEGYDEEHFRKTGITKKIKE